MNPTFLGRRGLGIALTTAAVLAMSWVACTGTGSADDDTTAGNGPDAPLVLSASKVPAGQFITVSHPSIRAGDTVEVRFRQLDGPEWTLEVSDADAGGVRFQVPPLVSLIAGGGFRGGIFRISVVGINDERSLEVELLTDLSDLPPGTVLDLLLRSAINDFHDIETMLRAGQDVFGTLPNTAATISTINDERRRLEDLRFQLVLNKSLRVPISEDEEITLTEIELRSLDRYLAVMLAGLRDELRLANGSSTARVLQEGCWDQILQGRLEGKDEITACVFGIIEDVKQDTLDGAKTAVKAMGAVVVLPFTVGGAIVHEGRLFLTGVLVTAGNSVASYLTAYFSKENTDAFLLRQGERFNAGKEAASQLFRNLTNFLGGLPEAAGLFFTTVNVGTSIKDLTDGAVEARCGQDPSRRVIQGDDDVAFCLIVILAETPDDEPDDACGGCPEGLVCDEVTASCVICLDNQDCPDELVCSPALRFCVECVDDADCVASGRGTRCSVIACVDEGAQCATDADCRDAGLGNTCYAETNRCLDIPGRCFADSDCAGNRPYCLPVTRPPGQAGDCFECRSDADCDDGVFCNGAEICSLFFNQCNSGPLPCLRLDWCHEATQSCIEP